MAIKQIEVDKSVEQPNKVLDMIGYFIFIIPLVTMKNDFDRFHANQATVLAICAVVVNVIVFVVSMVSALIGGLLSFVLGIGVFALAIIGLLNVNKLECKPLPVIGELFQVIKY